MNFIRNTSVFFLFLFIFSCSNEPDYEINEDGPDLGLDFSDMYPHLEGKTSYGETNDLDLLFRKLDEEIYNKNKEELLEIIDSKTVTCGSIGLIGMGHLGIDNAHHALFGKLNPKQQIDLLETGTPAQKYYAFKRIAVNNRARALNLLDDIVCDTSEVHYMCGCTTDCITLGSSYVEAFLQLEHLCKDEFLKLKQLRGKLLKNSQCPIFPLRNYDVSKLPDC